MGAVRTRLRAELRAHWRAWGAIALLIGLAGGVVLTTAAGARRTDTAYTRYLQASRAADMLVSPQNVGRPRFYDAVGKLPEVTVMATLDAFYAGKSIRYDSYDGAFVRLKPGSSMKAFTRKAEDLARQFPEAGTPLFVADQHAQAAKVQRAMRPQATALALFALLAAVAALLVVGQIVSRQLFLAATENPT